MGDRHIFSKTEIPPQVHVIASAILFVTIALLGIGTWRALKRPAE